MYYFVCSSKACVKQAFRTSWEPQAMGSMSSTMVTKESSRFASAVRTVHAFLHLCTSTELSSIRTDRERRRARWLAARWERRLLTAAAVARGRNDYYG